MSPLYVIVLVLSAVVLALSLRRRGPRTPFPVGSPEADMATLAALRQAGADLTQETEVRFYLYFPAKDQAERAAEGTRNSTFVPAVEPAATGSRWLCRVVAKIVPSESTIRDASIRFKAVAATMGGVYDGWEAQVRPGPRSLASASSGAAAVPVFWPPVNAFVKWLIAGLLYLIGPFRIHRTHRVPPPGSVALLSAEDERAMPAELLRYLTDTDRTLRTQGFGTPLHISANPIGNVMAYASLLEREDRSALATVLATRSVRGDSAAGVVFRSQLPDGRVLITSNSRAKGRFPRRPTQDAIAFPEVLDPAALYDIHRFRLRERMGGASPPAITRSSDPLSYQTRETTEIHEHWVQTGYYRRQADGALRLTWRGALATVWRGKFPWAQLTEWRDRRARSSVLARYAAALH